MAGWKYLTSRLGSKNRKPADLDHDIDPTVWLQQMLEAGRRRHRELVQQTVAVMSVQRYTAERLSRARDDVEELTVKARQAEREAELAAVNGDAETALHHRRAHAAFTEQLLIVTESVEQLESVYEPGKQTVTEAMNQVRRSELLLQQREAEHNMLLTRLEHATTREQMNKAPRAIDRPLRDASTTASLGQAHGQVEHRYISDLAGRELAGHSNLAGGPPNLQMPSLPGGSRSAVVTRILIGMCMSLSAILAAAAPMSGGDQGIEIAAVAAASVPAVGAVISTVFQSELGEIANANLRRTLWIGQVLAFLAVISFVVSVTLGASGLVSAAGTVYTALASGTLGGVSLLVSNRAKEARNLALTIGMINSIEDPQLRDQTRAEVALEASRVSRGRTLGVVRGSTT